MSTSQTSTADSTSDIGAEARERAAGAAETYRADAARFGEVVHAGGNWAGASPCDGWTAADVVAHVVDTERDFLARHDVDLGARPDGDPASTWDAHLAAVAAVLTPDLLSREFDGYFGPTTIGATFAQFYAWDLVVHRWDLARALGVPTSFTDAELDRLEASIPDPGTPMYEAFYSEGICRPPLPVPDGASRETAVLAALGRRG